MHLQCRDILLSCSFYFLHDLPPRLTTSVAVHPITEITQNSSCEKVRPNLKDELCIPQRFCKSFIGTERSYTLLFTLIHFLLDNYVDGIEFLSLTRDDLFKIFEAAGIVKVLRHLDQL